MTPEQKANVLHLADVIERGDYEFDMGSPHLPRHLDARIGCVTPGCIAGTAAVVFPAIVKEFDSWNTSSLINTLGLYYYHYSELVYPDGKSFHDTGKRILYYQLTRQGAVATLRRFASTTQVKWLQREQV